MFGYGTPAKFLRFGCLIYYIITISYRVLFLEHYNVFGDSISLIFDYLIDFFFLCDALLSNPETEAQPAPKTNQQVLSSAIHRQTLVVSRNAQAIPLRIPTARKPLDHPIVEKLKIILPQFVMLFPFEIIGLLAAMPGYYALRAIRLTRCAYFIKYWVDIGDFLQKNKIATTAGARRVIIFFVVMVVAAHVFAGIFYAIAIDDLQHNLPNNWLVVDGLATVNTTTSTNELLETVSYRYLRAMYWSVQTITTVGFGDIVAHSESETWFCIGLFFFIALFVNFTLANLTMAISHFDAAYTQNLMKISRFEKYAAYRRLPPALTARVVSYYEHQWKKLRGVDELQIYSELPTRLSNQVMHQVIRDKLLQIEVLNTLNKSCLNALTRRVESYVYSPQDIIIKEHGQVGGVFIISEGIVARRHSKSKHAPYELYEGQTFGEGALLETYPARHSYSAKTYCEILFLPGPTFRHLCQMYLAVAEVDNVIHTLTELTHQQGIARLSNPGSPFKKVHRLSIFGKTSLIRVDAAVAKPKVVDSIVQSFLRGCFYPDSKFRILWDCIIFCGILFYAISCGLLVQAMLRQDYWSHYFPLLLASYSVDFIFIVDVIFNAFFFGYDQDGIIVTDAHKICIYFMKHRYPIAILCVVLPLDVLFGFLINRKLVPVLRLVKTLHLTRFNVYWANVENALLQYASIAISFEVSRFLNLYIILFILCHWCGCAWTLTAEVSMKIFHYKTSWRYAETHTSFYHYDYKRLEGTMPYWREIYWPVNVLSGISWSDQLPTNPVEVISICCIMIFGLLLFCTLIGALSSLMERFNRIRRDYNTKVDKIRQLVKQKSVSKEIEGKINRYYEYIWARYGGVDESEVLGNLPKSLRAAVANHVLAPLLKKIPFFDSCSEPMEQMIVSLFETRIFLQDDALMLCGEVGQDMFIIEHGEVEITSSDRAVTFARLADGDYVGESCFLDITKRTASAFAVDYVDTYFLTRDNFLKAAEKFPAEYRIVIEAIRATLQQKATRNAAAAAVSPLARANTMLTTEHKLRLQRGLLKANQDLAAALAASLGIVHPESNPKLIWDLVISCTLLYYAIVIPLRLAINLNVNILWVDYVCDFLNLVDNFLCIKVFAVYSAGELLVDNTAIRKNYLKTRFVYDFLATIPYDLIALAYTYESTDAFLMTRALLRLPKLVRLCLTSHYIDQIKRLLYKVNVSTALMQVIQLTSAILMIMHWVGCVFYILAEHAGPLGDCVSPPGAYYGTACRFRNTWVGQQISIDLLPSDGGSQWLRFLKALYWALGTTVAVSLGEILIMSDIEVVYAFLVTFFGLCINGMILGSIMTLVAESSEDSSRIYRDMEILQSYLIANKVPQELVNRATAQLRHLSTPQGYLTVNQTAIFAELPHSIKLAIDNQVKTIPFLRRCPIFDFCNDEILRGISAKLQVQFNVKNDKIIVGGELGHEMYFVESGAVNVVSLDGLIVYSTLEEGAFFGETAIFFHTVRSASVVVTSPFCVCLRLAKADLEHELRSADFDPEQVIKPFTALQRSNERRNKAVTANLALAKEPTSKLSKLVGLNVESHRAVSYIHRLRAYMVPTCAFRVAWDCLGFLLLVYYALSIVFYIAFFFGPKIDLYMNFIAFDFLIDFYWVVDILLKAYVFGYKADIMHDRIITDGDAIYKHYLDSGYFGLDIFASIPFELFALVPNTQPVLIFILRTNHFVRVLQVNDYANLLEFHLQTQLGVTFSRATWQLMRICALYCAIVHWMACGYFMIHRYAERHAPVTYVIADGMATYDPLTHQHDICNHKISFCYARSLYFVLGTVAGIGYGDIIPQTTKETLYQMLTIIIDAFLAATLHGFCAIYLEEHDAKSNDIFHAKMQKLQIFIAFRKLPKVTADAILAQYTHMWRKVKSTRAEKNEILALLSQSSAMDLSVHLQAAVIKLVPLLNELAPQTSRRIALVLHPQIATADTYLYKAGDAGECIFFVSHGAMQAELNSDLSLLDARGIAALQILAHKHKCHGDVHKAGDHFGEFCVVSRAGLRAESIKVLSGSEVYSLNRADLWAIFQYLTYEDRRTFIYNLMTRVGGRRHITTPLSQLSQSFASQTDDTRLKVLYRIAFDTMSEIIDALNEEDVQQETASEASSQEHERHHSLKLLLRHQSMKASLFSQRDLIDLFERENTVNPTVQFSEVAMRSRLSSFANPEPIEGINRRFSSFSATDRAALSREDSFRNRVPSFATPVTPLSPRAGSGPGTPLDTPRSSSKVMMVSADELFMRDIDESDGDSKNDKDDDNDSDEQEDDRFMSAQVREGNRKRSRSNHFVHKRVMQLSAPDNGEIELREATTTSPLSTTPRNTIAQNVVPRKGSGEKERDRKGSAVRFDPEIEVMDFESPTVTRNALSKSSSNGKGVELKHRSSDVDYNVVRNAMEIEQVVGVGRRRHSTSIDLKDVNQLYEI